METFKEWFNLNSDAHPYSTEAKNLEELWNHQQQKIEKLEAELKELKKLDEISIVAVITAEPLIKEIEKLGTEKAGLVKMNENLHEIHHERVEKLEADKAKLVECVRFYASRSNWFGDSTDGFIEIDDTDYCRENPLSIGGKRARQCLKDLGIGERE